MRLWSFHPKYLDRAGLLACWREGLLAKACLEGKTRGYINHPQLLRFKKTDFPSEYINEYLFNVFIESKNRKYNFDVSKINHFLKTNLIPLHDEQLIYEWKHFLKKLTIRDVELYSRLKHINIPEINPIFRVVKGDIESWEKII